MTHGNQICEAFIRAIGMTRPPEPEQCGSARRRADKHLPPPFILVPNQMRTPRPRAFLGFMVAGPPYSQTLLRLASALVAFPG